MAVDDGYLHAADTVIARRYTWSPPALSLGKFQRVSLLPNLPFDVVRRPTGGRAVLHGESFEWSLAVVFPEGSLCAGPAEAVDVAAPYKLVVDALRQALMAAGVLLEQAAETTRPAALCFAAVMRHDLLAGNEKVVALAQAREGRRVLVHGSVLERRPPARLTEAVERLLGEPWNAEGLAGAGHQLARDVVWASFVAHLRAGLQGTRTTRNDGTEARFRLPAKRRRKR